MSDMSRKRLQKLVVSAKQSEDEQLSVSNVYISKLTSHVVDLSLDHQLRMCQHTTRVDEP